ncbi:KGD1 [Symbiodinium sp. CCMP2592]|nr:KGD1 [Symbiodinium sp. CCMP2592]
MRCGPVMTASPRKSIVPPPPIGSPRLARGSIATKDAGGARLSAIGRMALRDKPSQQQHSAALYGGGRLWPRYAEQVCERPPLAPRKEGSRTLEASPCSRPQSARGIPGATTRSTSAPRCPAAGQRGASLPREGPATHPGPSDRGPPQRAASSLDCSAYDVRAGIPPMQGRAAIARNILGPGGATALQEDLGYKRTEIHVPPGHSLAQTVENLLQGLAQASPDGLHRKPSVQGSLQRDYSVPTMVDEVVLYSEPEDDDARPGLGSVQPRGRAEVMQQWLRPDSIQAVRCRGERRAEERRSEAPRQKPLALRGAAQAPEAAAELDWGSLSDNSRQAIKQWVTGQLGGRHCMLVLEQGCAETLLLPSASEMLATSDLRGGAVLNVLSGLFAEGGLLNPSSGSGLFQAVFSKHPLQVLEEALEQCLLEISDPRVERVADLSPDQVNLALKQMSMKAQFASCTAPGADAAALSASSDECTKVQVWTELARLHVEGWPSPAHAGPVPAPATSKERPAVPGPKPNSEKVFGDGGVLKELGKEEVELEAESQQMSLETLRAQNRLIEEYVMRLVRQRDELKQVTKMAEERDSYHILGLHGPSCSEDEVKKAYRNLARKEHPDKAGIGNKRRFQAIQQAYSSILKQRQLGGAATVAAEEENPPPEEVFGPSAILDESYRYAQEARASAECVARCGHRALRSWDEGAEGHGKRRVLRSLRDLTRQSASELRGAASQLRALSHASAALAKCAEALLGDCADLGETLNSAMALRDRCAMAEDAGRACGGSAELLDRISDATEATLRKVEKASPESSQGEARGRSEEATNLLRLGARLLAESLARTAAVGRRTADEAISAALKALDLHRGMIMLDIEARKERERLSRHQRFDDDDGPVAAGAPSSGCGAAGKGAGRDRQCANVVFHVLVSFAHFRNPDRNKLSAESRPCRDLKTFKQGERQGMGRVSFERGDAELAEEAEALLAALTPEEATFAGGERRFSWRGVEVDFYELEEDPQTDLLFGYGLWPVAATLARLLANTALDGEVQGHPIPSVKGKSILEIGAGVGLPSLVCRALGAAQVTITDAELRLVDALQEHHGHHPELRFAVLDWKLDAGEEAEVYDVIVASDILLACCEGPVFVPQLLARRLRRSPEARALLLNAHRGERSQRTAMREMRRQGFLVSSFAVSSSQELHSISEERFSAIPEASGPEIEAALKVIVRSLHCQVPILAPWLAAAAGGVLARSREPRATKTAADLVAKSSSAKNRLVRSKKFNRTSFGQTALMVLCLYLMAQVAQISQHSWMIEHAVGELEKQSQEEHSGAVDESWLDARASMFQRQESVEDKKALDECYSSDLRSWDQESASLQRKATVPASLAEAQRKIADAKKEKAEAQQRKIKDLATEADTVEDAAATLAILATNAAMESHRLEVKASGEASAASDEQVAAALAEEEADADEAQVAATEWIPVWDVLDDVVGGAAVLGLQSKAAEEEASSLSKSAAAARDKYRAATAEGNADRLIKEKVEKQMERQSIRSEAAILRRKATALTTGAVVGMEEFTKDEKEMDEKSKEADRLEDASLRSKRNAELLQLRSRDTSNQSTDAQKRADHLKDEAASLRSSADKKHKQAQAMSHLASCLLILVSFSAMMLMWSLYPSFSRAEMSNARHLQLPLLWERAWERDPRRGQCKWNFAMQVLERCTFLMCTLWVGSYFAQNYQIEGVWPFFLKELCAIGAVALPMFFCAAMWARADLHKAVSCGCLSRDSARKLIIWEGLTEWFWSANNAVAIGILVLYCSLGYHRSCSSHGMEWGQDVTANVRMSMLLLGLSAASLRTSYGVFRCGCACNLQVQPHQPGTLQVLAARYGWVFVVLIVAYVTYSKFEHFFYFWADNGELLQGSAMPRAARAALRPALAAAEGVQWVQRFREVGHLWAKLDPLGRCRGSLARCPDWWREDQGHVMDQHPLAGYVPSTPSTPPRHLFVPRGLLHAEGGPWWTREELLRVLEDAYCGHLSFEVNHLPDMEQRRWWHCAAETPRPPPPAWRRRAMLARLLRATLLTQFLRAKFPATKWFGLDGSEVLLPGLFRLCYRSAARGVEHIEMGMPHRGRLNILANILGKELSQICCEMREDHSDFHVGDVKYHTGYVGELPNLEAWWHKRFGASDSDHIGESVRSPVVTITPNPSHLEMVTPVVLGKVRALQDLAEASDRGLQSVLGIVLHGDAAFAGSGMAFEALQFAELPGYGTGGTVHVVLNNQVGYTTTPNEGRSAAHPSDVAKALDLPIIHVNADDVEAADRAFGLAAEWRADFQRDVVIDLVGYRRFGHNETDRPDVFHPLAYARVREHPEVAKIYAAKLVSEGVLSESEVAEMRTAIWNELDAEFLEKDRHKKDGMDWVLRKYRGRIDEGRRPKQVKGVTGVPLETLHRIGHAMTGIPETVTSHSEVEKLLSKRRAMFAPGGRIDFATAEQLAFCSILLHRDIWAGDAGATGSWAVAGNERLPNRNVRLAGQDCVRGTFNQRHLIVQDSVRGAGVSLLPQALAPGNQANFYAYNSPLSEAAALAFEYGYSLGDEDALVCWEAQFGDFANCAQAVIDEFIVSGEEKWGQASRLTLLLPHGYDGQGPNHSSARLERFLQLTNDDPNHLPGNSPEELREIERAFEILDAEGAGILEEGAVKSYMERLPAFQSREFEDEWELWLRVARNMNPEATGITRRDWRMIMQQLYRRNAEKDANIFVLNVTTPAQYFHVLRRQAHRPFMKPLVLMSPKYLLHHAKATSPLEDFGEQSHFMRVIVDYSPFGKDFASRSDNTRHLSTSRSGRPLTEPPEAARERERESDFCRAPGLKTPFSNSFLLDGCTCLAGGETPPFPFIFLTGDPARYAFLSTPSKTVGGALARGVGENILCPIALAKERERASECTRRPRGPPAEASEPVKVHKCRHRHAQLERRSEAPLQSSSRGHSTRHSLQRPGLLHAFAARSCKSTALAVTKAAGMARLHDASG